MNLVFWFEARTVQVGARAKPADTGQYSVVAPAYVYARTHPVEHLWEELREKFFNNPVFGSIDALEDHLEAALHTFEQEHHRIRSIVRWS